VLVGPCGPQRGGAGRLAREPGAACDGHAARAALTCDRSPLRRGAAGGPQLAYWDALDGQAIRVLAAPCRLGALAVHAGGELLAAGGEDGVIRLHNYDEGARRPAQSPLHILLCLGAACKAHSPMGIPHAMLPLRAL